MKRLFIVCVLIFSCHSYCNAQTLEVNIRDCRVKNDRYVYLNEFKLYKDDVLIRTVSPDYKSKQIIQLKVLGKYRIEYKTIFDRTESIFIDITTDKKHTVELCLDYFNYKSDPYVPIISRLQNGENYTIEIESRGCFHYSKDTIVVLNKTGEFYVVYGGNEKKLSESGIKAIKRFEIELNHMQSEGCTTVDTYILTYKNESMVLFDGGCKWHGGGYLKSTLNLVKE